MNHKATFGGVGEARRATHDGTVIVDHGGVWLAAKGVNAIGIGGDVHQGVNTLADRAERDLPLIRQGLIWEHQRRPSR